MPPRLKVGFAKDKAIMLRNFGVVLPKLKESQLKKLFTGKPLHFCTDLYMYGTIHNTIIV